MALSISAARMWRWASARTCQLCQVERCAPTAASTFSAVIATHSAFTSGPLDRHRIEGIVDHRLDRIRSPDRFDGLGMPSVTLVGQAAGLVFRVTSFLGGLLGKVQCLHRRWWPAMITLKPGRQLTLPVLDQYPAGRPALVQSWVDADNSRIGRLAGSVSARSANRTRSRSRR